MSSKLGAARNFVKCPPWLKRNYRLVIMFAAIAYVIFIKWIEGYLGLAIYISIFIGLIAVVQFTSLSRCDTAKKYFFTLLPSFLIIIVLLVFVIFLNGTTLSLLGIDSGVASQAGSDFSGAVGNVWLLAYQGVSTGTAATSNWMAYGPSLFGAGIFIMAWGDSRDDGITKGFGTLLMFVPLVIDLMLNLSGTPAGLITDLIPQLSYLPTGGIMVLVTMLLNILPDGILLGLLIGLVERSVVEKYASPMGE